MDKGEELLACIKRPSNIPDTLKTYNHRTIGLQDSEWYTNFTGLTYLEIKESFNFLSELFCTAPKYPFFSNKIHKVKRDIAENNLEYIQLVSAIAVKCKSKMILLKCISGDMLGKTTLIQGHCDYNNLNMLHTTTVHFMCNEAVREFYEELYVDDKLKEIVNCLYKNSKHRLISFNLTEPNDISYFHIANIFTLEIPDELYPYLENKDYIRSNEENKNEVVIVDFEDDITKYNPDSWLIEVFKYHQHLYKTNLNNS